jgi:hypothetical protein
MLTTAIAQLRFATSIASSIPFCTWALDRLVEGSRTAGSSGFFCTNRCLRLVSQSLVAPSDEGKEGYR